jgi:hypothetical protein
MMRPSAKRACRSHKKAAGNTVACTTTEDCAVNGARIVVGSVAAERSALVRAWVSRSPGKRSVRKSSRENVARAPRVLDIFVSAQCPQTVPRSSTNAGEGQRKIDVSLLLQLPTGTSSAGMPDADSVESLIVV